ncbi:MAG: gluconokinase, partial [Pyrinomonadaceae bacterium]|nr:gluconokinase [Pyrinomonadaceae bacterium]
HSRQLTATKDGGFEIDADRAFEQVVGVIDELYEKCDEKRERAGFGAISSFWHSLVGVDDAGNPTTKLFAWAETRPARYVHKLRSELNEAEVHNRTGCPFHSSYWPAKLLWIKESLKEEFERTSLWLSFPEFMGLQMFGTAETSISMASGTGIFDIRNKSWDKPLLDYLEIRRSSLPQISHDASPNLELTSEYQDRWPDIAKAKWHPAVGDGAANNVGAGCLSKERAALMIGTSGAMRVAWEGKVPEKIPTGLWCYLIDSKRVVMGGALSDGGGLYRWLKENLRLSDDDDDTEALIAKREPAGHGLAFLPFLAGERSTGYNEYATGAVLGLRSANDQIDIVQAALESVAYRFKDVFDRLCGVFEIREVIASGGALRESPVWTQIISDVIARDMVLPQTREASSRGAVLLASLELGLISEVEPESTVEARHFSFNISNREIYQEAYERHQQFYLKLVTE